MRVSPSGSTECLCVCVCARRLCRGAPPPNTRRAAAVVVAAPDRLSTEVDRIVDCGPLANLYALRSFNAAAASFNTNNALFLALGWRSRMLQRRRCCTSLWRVHGEHSGSAPRKWNNRRRVAKHITTTTTTQRTDTDAHTAGRPEQRQGEASSPNPRSAPPVTIALLTAAGRRRPPPSRSRRAGAVAGAQWHQTDCCCRRCRASRRSCTAASWRKLPPPTHNSSPSTGAGFDAGRRRFVRRAAANQLRTRLVRATSLVRRPAAARELSRRTGGSSAVRPRRKVRRRTFANTFSPASRHSRALQSPRLAAGSVAAAYVNKRFPLKKQQTLRLASIYNRPT